MPTRPTSPRARRRLTVFRLSHAFHAPCSRCTAGTVYTWAACSCPSPGCCAAELVDTAYCVCQLGHDLRERHEREVIAQAGGPPRVTYDPDFPF